MTSQRITNALRGVPGGLDNADLISACKDFSQLLYIFEIGRRAHVHPNSIPYQQQPGFQRTYRQGRLTLGLFFPSKPLPVIRRACSTRRDWPNVPTSWVFLLSGFATCRYATPVSAIRVRSSILGSTWVMAAHTRTIALGTASIILPIRNPCIPPRLQPVSISSAVAACYSVWLLVTGRWSSPHSVSTRNNATAVPRIPSGISRGSAQQFRAFDLVRRHA